MLNGAKTQESADCLPVSDKMPFPFRFDISFICIIEYPMGYLKNR